MHLVVNERQVGCCGSLPDTTKLIIDGTVTEANPSLVSSEIRNWDATQMSTNGRADKNGRVTGIRDLSLRILVELRAFRQGVGLIDLTLSETTDEDHFSVP